VNNEGSGAAVDIGINEHITLESTRTECQRLGSSEALATGLNTSGIEYGLRCSYNNMSNE